MDAGRSLPPAVSRAPDTDYATGQALETCLAGRWVQRGLPPIPVWPCCIRAVGMQDPGAGPMLFSPQEPPSTPSEYAVAATQAVLAPALQGIQLLPHDTQVPTLTLVLTAFVEAWMEHILAHRIKFRYGAGGDITGAVVRE